MSEQRHERAPSRSEQRDAAARAALQPLRPGERPATLMIAALVALALAVLVLVGYATGARVAHHGATPQGAALLSALFLAAAVGIWRVRYWAVLGFEAYLAAQVLFSALALTVVSGPRGAVICLVSIVGGGLLFYKLVRVMARIQASQAHRQT